MATAAMESNVPFGISTGAMHLLLQSMKLLPGLAPPDVKVGIVGVGARGAATSISETTDSKVHAIIASGSSVNDALSGMVDAEGDSFDAVFIAQAAHTLYAPGADIKAALRTARSLLRPQSDAEDAEPRIQSRLALLWARAAPETRCRPGHADVNAIMKALVELQGAEGELAGAAAKARLLAAGAAEGQTSSPIQWHHELTALAAEAGLGVPMHRQLVDSVPVVSEAEAGAVLRCCLDATVGRDCSSAELGEALGRMSWGQASEGEMMVPLNLHSWHVSSNR
ncbi:hypothetical protein FNF27_01398 [Cafeteria roenbergensis]|nr:hypothetical protein FNF29_05805 [Cafeteria roenbergensis]KAA0177068.1 hypothetical protein FNF27_01398 [Cafeteria roenbergensis]|eukprot:KAA0149593.1 hypothetical protein FNF29_05805 [Cafeteria roenbergensis]